MSLSGEMEVMLVTMERLINLGTPENPLTFKKGPNGNLDICIGKHTYCGYGSVPMLIDLVDAYANIKASMAMEQAKGPITF